MARELAFEKDRERDRLLLVEGWRVTRITWRQLRDDAPAVIADLSPALPAPDSGSLLPCNAMSQELFEHYLRDESARAG